MARAFVLGNGPSLGLVALDQLKAETTFAMNRVNLYWERTWPDAAWRPTYYFAFDFTHEDMLEDMLAVVDVAKHSFIRADRAGDIEIRRRSLDYPPHITYFWDCREHVGTGIDRMLHDPDAARRMPSAWHLPVLCGFASTLNIAMQVAVMQGYNPIYLLGCDLGFKMFEKDRDPDPNHFDPAYNVHDDDSLRHRDETLLFMHAIIKQETKAQGVEVINLTPNNRLDEIYPRKTLDEVL